MSSNSNNHDRRNQCIHALFVWFWVLELPNLTLFACFLMFSKLLELSCFYLPKTLLICTTTYICTSSVTYFGAGKTTGLHDLVHVLLLERTWVNFPVPTWGLTTIGNSSFRGPCYAQSTDPQIPPWDWWCKSRESLWWINLGLSNCWKLSCSRARETPSSAGRVFLLFIIMFFIIYL